MIMLPIYSDHKKNSDGAYAYNTSVLNRFLDHTQHMWSVDEIEKIQQDEWMGRAFGAVWKKAFLNHPFVTQVLMMDALQDETKKPDRVTRKSKM